jgi:hypothetical protein
LASDPTANTELNLRNTNKTIEEKKSFRRDEQDQMDEKSKILLIL